MPRGRYFVYILASKSRKLYVGVTNDLERRIYEHKQKLADGFTAKYRIDRLVHFEETPDVLAAIEREKQIKGAASSEEDRPCRVHQSDLGRSQRSVVQRKHKSRFFASLRMTPHYG